MIRNIKGVALALIALVLSVIIGLGALVIDLAHAYSIKTGIQNAVDLSALAGVSQLADTSSSSISNAKNTTLTLLNTNLTMTLVSFSPLTLGSNGLTIQTGVYDSSSMIFTPTESSSSINSIRVSYTYTKATVLGKIFNVSNLNVADTAIAAKQIATGALPGTGFPLAIKTSVLSDALSNGNMIDLYASGGADNSFWTDFTSSNPSTTDISNVIDYFQTGTGTSPPAITVNDTFAINDGGMGGVFMNLDSSVLVGMTYLFAVITDNADMSMATTDGFVAGTINNIVNSMGSKYISITIQPGYIDNTFGGLQVSNQMTNVSSGNQSLLANSFGIVL